MPIEVLDVKEHEDGSATYTFDMDQESSDLLTEVGLKLILFCGAAGISTEEVFDSVRQKIDKRLAEPFDQGHYGED
jgi:NTP pyrophosphatase (non-canonical NTP hydrolase)